MILHGFGERSDRPHEIQLMNDPAMMVTMLAAIPVVLNVYRRYYQNNPQVGEGHHYVADDAQVDAGWFAHGTLLAATVLCFVSVRFSKAEAL